MMFHFQMKFCHIHDRIPTDATRALKIVTGTYSERMYYKITYKTNYRDYRVLAENLLTKNSYECGESIPTSSLAVHGSVITSQINLKWEKN